MFSSINDLEKQKERISSKYYESMCELYERELYQVFIWFVKKFPKRHLKWVSAMGSSIFVLDGEILHWHTLRDVYSNDGWTHGYADAIPDRKAKVLLPLWNIFQSINNVLNCVAGEWIQTREFDSNNFKWRLDYV